MQKNPVLFICFDDQCPPELSNSVTKNMRKKNVQFKIVNAKNCHVMFYKIDDATIDFYEHNIKNRSTSGTPQTIILVPKQKLYNYDTLFLRRSNAITDQIVLYDDDFNLHLFTSFKYRRML